MRNTGVRCAQEEAQCVGSLELQEAATTQGWVRAALSPMLAGRGAWASVAGWDRCTGEGRGWEL